MIDLKRWIYSDDMADWFSLKEPFPVEMQMNFICSAPYRTVSEKLMGLGKLYEESGEKMISDRIKDLDSLYRRSGQDVLEKTRFFQTEIFYQGHQEPRIPMFFQTAKQAANDIKLRIGELSAEYGLQREQYHGIIRVYHKTDFTDQFLHEENFVTRYDGEVLFAWKPYYRQSGGNCFHMEEKHSTETADNRFPYWEITWKIPYSSGSIVTVRENPFFPSIKGVLVNTAEPDSADFADDRYNQWLICAEQTYTEQTHGIDVINLSDDYVPFPCSMELELPYKQYISAYQGKLIDTEMWLEELSERIRSDKSCVKTLLRDRAPDSRRRMEYVKKRFAYVAGLGSKKIGK